LSIQHCLQMSVELYLTINVIGGIILCITNFETVSKIV
jgi:hypothetical protein